MDSPSPNSSTAALAAPAAPPSLGRWIVITGWHAAKANRWAALLLWIFGSLLVGSYFYWPAARHLWDALADLKNAFGIWPWFAMVSTAIAGGLIPFLGQSLQTGVKHDFRLRSLAFVLIFWAEKGIEVDYLYRFQDWFWGSEPSLGVIIGKVAIDQFVYVPILGLPTLSLAYAWRKRDYSWTRLRADFTWRWYIRATLPLYVMNMMVWIPTVSMIYMLPLPLQLPVENLVLAFWSLVLLVLTHDADEPAIPAPQAVP